MLEGDFDVRFRVVDEAMPAVLTLKDIIAATELLRQRNAPAVDGHYVAFISRRQRGCFLGMALVEAWAENTRRRWAADERAARGEGS